MLWIGGQVTTVAIITRVFIPSLISMLVPLAILSFILKGNVKRPLAENEGGEYTTSRERVFMLILGLAALINVPIFNN